MMANFTNLVLFSFPLFNMEKGNHWGPDLRSEFWFKTAQQMSLLEIQEGFVQSLSPRMMAFYPDLEDLQMRCIQGT